jgi:peptide/nickel transport system substrate-binding protein
MRVLKRPLGKLLALSCSAILLGLSAPLAAQTPVSGGTLTYYQDVEPDNWNLTHVWPTPLLVLGGNVVDRLIHLGDDGEYYPWLASSWEISDDGKLYTFHLRKDVKFHNGEVFNAHAVAANFDMWKADPSTTTLRVAGLEGYEVVDDYTIRLSFTNPSAQAMWVMSVPAFGFLAPDAVKNHASDLSGDPTKMIGTGPFKVTAYTRGQGMTLERNPDYAWAPSTSDYQGPAYLDGVKISFAPDPSVRVGVLTSGQADLIANVPSIFVPQLESAANTAVWEQKSPGLPYHLDLNVQKAPMDDIRVRKALRAALDVPTALQAVYFGKREQAWTSLSPATPLVGAYNETLENSWAYNAEEAAKLLDEAGWSDRDAEGYRVKDGQRLALDWTVRASLVEDQRDTLSEALQSMVRDAGIELRRTPVDSGAYTAQMKDGDYHLTDRSMTTPDVYILRRIYASNMLPTAGVNYSRVGDPAVDAIVDPLVTSRDNALRVANARKAQELDFENVWSIPLYVRVQHFGSNKKVQGLSYDASGWLGSFYTTWLQQ